MKRRDFFKALAGGMTAGAAVPLLPMPAPPLQFHPLAFSSVFDPNCFDVVSIPINPPILAPRLDTLYGWKK